MCCWDRDRSPTKLIFSWYVCLKNAIFVSECSEDMYFVKNGSKMYLGDNEAKKLVIVCDRVHFSLKNEWTQNCLYFSRGAGPWLNPCDTDSGNELWVRGFAFYQPSLTEPLTKTHVFFSCLLKALLHPKSNPVTYSSHTSELLLKWALDQACRAAHSIECVESF